jgi:TPR repeat protein
MSGKIFISYRRDDASYPAGRVYDRISAVFPQSQIFMDVDNLDPGVDFVEAIQASVSSCDVLIAVIGKRWLVSSDEEGRRRLDNLDDFVRLEIATALKRNIRVIPVLVDGVLVPRSTELPDDLKPLVRRNALEVSHERFRFDSGRLTDAIKRGFEQAEAEQRQREQKERLEAEQREKDHLEAVRRDKERLEAKERVDRLEAQRREAYERLEAERYEHQEKERLEAEPRAPPPSSVAPSTPPAKPEATEPSVEIPKVVYPQAPKPVEQGREKPTASSSDVSKRKSPSKQVIAFLAIAAVLMIGGLNYFAIRPSQSPPPRPAPVAAALPSPKVITAAPVEEKAPTTPEVAVQSSAQPTVPVAAALPSPTVITAAPVEQKAPTTPEMAVQPSAQPTAPVTLVTPTPATIATPSAQEQAQRYLDMKDFAKALPHLQKAADAGDPIAMNNLGLLYENGQGIAQDYGKAREWYQKAADAGNADAMVGLGVLYQSGQGVAQDYVEAREWYQKAADAGNAHGMNKLGLLYENGQGVTQDYGKAREWYQKAAHVGDPIAMDKLAVLDRDGLGGAQDSKRPPTPATRPAYRTARVSPKITLRRASGTKTPPMPATQMRSNRSPARAQSSNAGDPGKTDWSGIPRWLTGP